MALVGVGLVAGAIVLHRGRPMAVQFPDQVAHSPCSARIPVSVSDEIQGAIRDVTVLGDPIQPLEAIEVRVSAITAADLSSWANALASSNEAGSASELQAGVLRRWTGGNPEEAAIWAAQQTGSVVRQEAIQQVALAWAETDLPKAVEWVAGLPSDAARSAVLGNLGYELARTAPVAALALVAALLPGLERDDLTVHAVSQWATLDALAATEWACAIPALALRERALASIVAAVADQNPEAAVILTTNAMWPGESQNQAAIAIIQRWTQQDPRSAAAWVQEFPSGDLQEAAIRNLVTVWSREGAEGPMGWLNSLPSDAMRAVGAEALAGAGNVCN